jgi:hypothetical protein
VLCVVSCSHTPTHRRTKHANERIVHFTSLTCHMLRDILQRGVVLASIATTLYFGSLLAVGSVDVYQRSQVRKVCVCCRSSNVHLSMNASSRSHWIRVPTATLHSTTWAYFVFHVHYQRRHTILTGRKAGCRGRSGNWRIAVSVVCLVCSLFHP